MNVESFLDWLEETPVAVFIQTSPWAFAAIEVVHVIAVVMVYGVIVIVDLRLLGLAGHSRRYAELASESLHWVWGAFLIAFISGALMFASQASPYYENTYFRVKMLCVLLAGINMLVMEFVISKNKVEWGTGRGSIPPAGRVAGLLSLALWTVVLVSGRWIGFTMFVGPSF